MNRDQPVEASPAIGVYELLAVIGRGGMGTVYQARHRKLNRIVALKMLAPERVDSPQAAKRFHREMESVGRLDHVNIARAHDAGESPQGHFLVMEYVEGANLAQVVDKQGALSVGAACELVRRAALALQHAHEQGLVHRDVKPSNLMLTTRGELKVLDFGLAQQQLDADRTRLTADGRVVGTINYMAPEQGGAEGEVDTRADIYSLGCTLFFLITGRAVFSGPEYQTIAQKLRAHAEDAPPTQELSQRGAPSRLTAVFLRMVAKRPDDRYSSPREIVEALAPFSDDALLKQVVSALEPPQLTPLPADASFGPTTPVPGVFSTPGLDQSLKDTRADAGESRESRRARWPILLIPCAAAAVTWLAVEWWSHSGASNKTPLDHAPSELPPAGTSDSLPPPRWRAVLGGAPQELHWPLPKAQNTWEFLDDASQTLRLVTWNNRLLSFGAMPAGEFTFRIELRQFPWQGRCGVFFGCEQIDYRGEQALRMHLLEVVVSAGKDGRREARLHRQAVVFRPVPFEDFVSAGSLSQSFKLPANAKLPLTIRAGPTGIHRIELNDGQVLESLTTRTANEYLVNSEFPMTGCWGVFNGRTTSLFTNPHLQLTEKKHATRP